MIRIFRVLMTVALLTAFMGMGVGAVAAQENATANESNDESGIVDEIVDRLRGDDQDGADDDRADEQDDSADDRADEGDGELEAEVAADLNGTVVDTLENRETIWFNNHTRLVGWEFKNGEVTVAIHTDRRAGVTVSDALAGLNESGAVTVPKTSAFLERDEVTTVSMDVTKFKGGHAVGVSVGGREVRLSSEMDEGGDNPLRYFGGEEGLFAGMGMSVTAAGGAAGFVIWREETGVIEA